MRLPGNTPLIEVDGIFAKLECANPNGSIKDRIAYYILEESERLGLLKQGMTVVEATSGNTGIALSRYARAKGYEVVIVMPENMTDERKTMIRETGAKLIECSEQGSFAEAASIRDEMAKEEGFFNPDQFSNPLNVECHERTTGCEIIEQMAGHAERIDAFVAGVGTGGTLIGVGKALRNRWGDVHLAAVEPTESAVMSGGEPGLHEIQGIGDGFIPAIAADESGGVHDMIDEVITVSSEEAMAAAADLRERFGFCVGISSGANHLAGQQLAGRFGTVVTVFSDGWVRYRSKGLHQCQGPMCPFIEDC